MLTKYGYVIPEELCKDIISLLARSTDKKVEPILRRLQRAMRTTPTRYEKIMEVLEKIADELDDMMQEEYNLGMREGDN